MSREYQQTRCKAFVMPDAVYYQSIWAVRDLSRMEAKLSALKRNRDVYAGGGGVARDGQVNYDDIRPTERYAVESAILENRIEAIRTALNLVPEGYRQFILSNITRKENTGGFPTKLWRIWKQRFLFNVAKNLALM